jgi:hypothetical protein
MRGSLPEVSWLFFKAFRAGLAEKRPSLSLNFDHLKDQEFALIKDLGQKRGSLYWLRGWEVFEQIKRPLLNSRGFCFLLPSRSALKIWGDGVSNDGG